MSDPYNLTPTEDLVMEVLVARTRLGEPFWPFDSVLKKQLERLEDLGLLQVHRGHVPKTLRCTLTQVGYKAFTLEDYVPPILRQKRQ